jgi:hypothetical protein
LNRFQFSAAYLGDTPVTAHEVDNDRLESGLVRLRGGAQGPFLNGAHKTGTRTSNLLFISSAETIATNL